MPRAKTPVLKPAIQQQQVNTDMTQAEISAVIDGVSAALAASAYGRAYALAAEFRRYPLLWQQQVDRINETVKVNAGVDYDPLGNYSGSD